MSNTHFNFKQFTIYNTSSSLKVGTDGVLLGAWAKVSAMDRVLDIGTGTGVIAFMMAQKAAAWVDAIDITIEAYNNAQYNVEKNERFKNIHIYHCALQNYKPLEQYNVIVCNPPWFVNSMKCADENKNTARHDDQLPANQLFAHVARLLLATGAFFTIIPSDLERHYTLCANQSGLSVQQKLYIKTKHNKPAKRVLLHYCFDATNCQTNELIIENEENLSYTDDYKALTRDFYLNF